MAFLSTGIVTSTLILHTVYLRMPSGVLISERIRPTPVTITGKLPHTRQNSFLKNTFICVCHFLYNFGVIVQVCQILQQRWGRVSHTYQGLWHPSGCHSSWTCKQILYCPSSGHCVLCCHCIYISFSGW